MTIKNRQQVLTFVLLIVVYGIAFGVDRSVGPLIHNDLPTDQAIQNFHIWFTNTAFIFAIATGVIFVCCIWLFLKGFPAFTSQALWILVSICILINYIPAITLLANGAEGSFYSEFMLNRGAVTNIGGIMALAGLIILYRKRRTLVEGKAKP